MRITLDIDPRVHDAVKMLAERQGLSVDRVIGDLLLKAIDTARPAEVGESPPAVHGFRPFPPGEFVVTNALIDELRSHDP